MANCGKLLSGVVLGLLPGLATLAHDYVYPYEDLVLRKSPHSVRQAVVPISLAAIGRGSIDASSRDDEEDDEDDEVEQDEE